MSQAAADALVAEAYELVRAEKFPEAAVRFEKASQLFPPHPLAWKGLGHALLCMGRPHDAARAFDRAVGLSPNSATALWGGAVAHADLGNKVVAQSYLRRALALQPTWIEMARGVAQLAPFLQLSTRTSDILRGFFPTFSTRTYRHAQDSARSIDVVHIIDQPRDDAFSYVT
ncbi:MAG TPA: tetratricopeptide repeat protein, partial [Kofleriaceae bacterium]|nr:tetratricopeptide repeat protein [Kofleriaceae bacterium]